LNNNKLINPKLICAFCWFVLFFNYENARSKNQNVAFCFAYLVLLDAMSFYYTFVHSDHCSNNGMVSYATSISIQCSALLFRGVL